MPAQHDLAAETELWDTFAASAFKEDAEPSFCWTQYAGHGPGPELLGDPRSVLEIGCGTGRALAHLAQHGIAARGVDLSPVMVKKTTSKWGGTGAEFVCSEVLEYLREHEEEYDAVYSIFGAAWFTDPGRLFPLVRQRLGPGGVFVFSQPCGHSRRVRAAGHVQGRLRRKGDVHLPLQLPLSCLGAPAHPCRVRHGRRAGPRRSSPWAYRDAPGARGRSVTDPSQRLTGSA